ncbi:TlpA family protein disulfide reductase [Aestuariibacter sp. GS-14]|uniref:TlpA family protein disulfide reductase n=1 Tax=Aestuariibacter sp. GS-14 TaxID=2590670 RepID=UPI0011276615|nr:TlpA disulfide reductase family protein [Aestuariibacter sp. GS-14]TPV57848.1 TlpA family protein disulfide reductase [Aestuariibacter sp. GS-14]
MHSISIGPLGLSIEYALIWGALLLSWAGCYVFSRRADSPVTCYQFSSNAVFGAFAVGFFFARLGFIAGQWSYFHGDVMAMLDVRDGGFSVGSGLIATGLYVSYSIHRHPAIRSTLMWAGAATSAVMLPLYVAVSLSLRPEWMPVPTVDALAGSPVTLSDFKDKPLVINFWATWCPPCRREMPALARAQQHNPDIHIVLINQSESPAQVQAFLAEQELALNNMLMDVTGDVSREFGVAVLPTTLFYSRDGKLIYRHVGGVSDASLAKAIRMLQAESTP